MFFVENCIVMGGKIMLFEVKKKIESRNTSTSNVKSRTPYGSDPLSIFLSNIKTDGLLFSIYKNHWKNVAL